MSKFDLAQAMETFSAGRNLGNITGVVINVGKDKRGSSLSYSAGNNSGYVLTVTNPIGTQAMASAILASLQLRGFHYQPFSAENAMLDPAVEIGDNIAANGINSVVMSISTTHSELMAATVTAPMDEEIDHEFQYKPKTVRQFERESAYTRSRLTVNEEAISAEVIRATGAEDVLSGRLTIAADAITAEVSRATAAEGTLRGSIQVNADAITSEVARAKSAEGTLGSRIDQRLDSITLSVTSANGSSTFTLKDGTTTLDTKTLNLTVPAVNISGKLTANQIEVSDLQAFGATIGGWSLDADEIKKVVAGKYNVSLYAPDTPGDHSEAFYLATWKDNDWDIKFKVTYGGKLTAKDADISGTVTATAGNIGGCSIENGLLKIPAAQITGTLTASQISVSDVSAFGATAGGWAMNSEMIYKYKANDYYVSLYAPSSPTKDNPAIGVRRWDTSISDWKYKFKVNYSGAIHAEDGDIAGWNISDSQIYKEATFSGIGLCKPVLYAPATASKNSRAFAVAIKPEGETSWTYPFAVTYEGKLTATGADISGKITADSGTIGGVTISGGKLTGIKGENIASGTITTGNVSSGIYSSLGLADAYGKATTNKTTVYPANFRAGYIKVGSLNFDTYDVRWSYVRCGDGVDRWLLCRSDQ